MNLDAMNLDAMNLDAMNLDAMNLDAMNRVSTYDFIPNLYAFWLFYCKQLAQRLAFGRVGCKIAYSRQWQ
jgi:hypothetical protein